jgi:hypothetical protein
MKNEAIETVKVLSVHADNFQRLRAVELDLQPDGLTVIGGGNAQGKTSLLRAIMYALGGKRMAPEMPTRSGAEQHEVTVELSNGVTVERIGEDLKIKGPWTGGQGLLQQFYSQFALDLPKFLGSRGIERVRILLAVLGADEKKLEALRVKEKGMRDDRQKLYGRKQAAQAHAERMPAFPDVEEEPDDAAPLRAIEAAREQAKLRESRLNHVAHLQGRITEWEAEITKLQELIATSRDAITQHEADIPAEQDTAELEQEVARVAGLRSKWEANQAKEAAHEEARGLNEQYQSLSCQIDANQEEQQAMLDGIGDILPELSLKEGEIHYQGIPWDGMSAAEQIRTGCAIVAQHNPECGFVLVDKLEQMDLQSLAALHDWATANSIQVIATRVSTGDECTVIIEDGGLATETDTPKPQPQLTEDDF